MAHPLLCIRSPPAGAIDFFWRTLNRRDGLMIMMSVTMPVLYQFILASCNDTVSNFIYTEMPFFYLLL